jgi:hypothetical protein
MPFQESYLSLSKLLGGYLGWEHPGMELEKWEDSASARTFAIIVIALKFGGA